MLDDDDPLWDRHTGGDGHRGEEWGSAEVALAESFYAQMAEGSTFIFDLLMDNPGKRIDADEIAGLRPTLFPRGRRSESGSLGLLGRVRENSGRRYPFYWWKGKNGDPTQYAMKPMVAQFFREGRRRVRDR
jgi:hypothetical protein